MNNKLWYKESAKSFSEALPFGNGSLGGMVYGGVPNEKITLNHDTLWSGTGTKPEEVLPDGLLNQARTFIFAEKYYEAEQLVQDNMLGFFNESYMPMATLEYEYLNLNSHLSDYRRELDLNSGVITTSFMAESSKYCSSIFSSYVDKAIFLSFKSDNVINMDFKLESLLRSHTVGLTNSIKLEGIAPSHVEPNYVECSESVFYNEDNSGMIFETILHIQSCDGEVTLDEGCLKVRNARSINLVLCAENGYKGFDKPLLTNREVLSKINSEKLEKLDKCSFDEIFNRHFNDFNNLMSRVELTLDYSDYSDMPTDLRLNRLKEGKDDLNFYALYLQYARYLMVSSSREGTEPSNLQGIWSDELRPPWSSNYTTNINVQMNYWMVCPANLAECFEPFTQLTKDLSSRGKETARKQYNCNGWAANHNVGLWRQSNPVSGLPKFAYWPMGGVWLASHLYDYYLHTLNRDYLQHEAYPIILGCVEFCLDWLITGPDGKLHTCPSTSPENVFRDNQGNICSVSYSSTMDISLIYELFSNYIAISEVVKVDGAVLQNVKDSIKKLPELHIDKEGAIQEWIKPFTEVEVGHRHLSPIYGLHPGNFINEYDSMDLVEASKNFVLKRVKNGGGQVGWSCAWLINIFSRLKDRTLAYKYLEDLITTSSYNNLLDLHPPLGENFEGEKEVYMIDGNFGGAAGIISLLLQSHLGEVSLLPCLPESWKKGDIKGLIAQGGFLVSIWWENGILSRCLIKSLSGSTLKIKYSRALVVYKDGREVGVSNSNNIAELETISQSEYEIKLK